MASYFCGTPPLNRIGTTAGRVAPLVVRVAVVDNCSLYRAGVIEMLASNPCFEFAGEGSTVGDALRMIYDARPDILLLGINDPDCEAGAAAAVLAVSAHTKTILLSAEPSEAGGQDVLDSGASVYISKEVTASELARVINRVHGARSQGRVRHLSKERRRFLALLPGERVAE